MSALNVTQYELIFEAPNQDPGQPATMRISITSDFEAPEALQNHRAQVIAMCHMGEDWRDAGLNLLDIRRIEENQVSIMEEAQNVPHNRRKTDRAPALTNPGTLLAEYESMPWLN